MSEAWKQSIPADGRLARAVRNAQLDQHNAEVLARITLETSAETPPLTISGRPAGDERTLRGIPAIGRNVAGAIPGTNPERNVERNVGR